MGFFYFCKINRIFFFFLDICRLTDNPTFLGLRITDLRLVVVWRKWPGRVWAVYLPLTLLTHPLAFPLDQMLQIKQLHCLKCKKTPSYPQSHFQKNPAHAQKPTHTHVWWRKTCMIISFDFVKESHITAWWSITKTNTFDLFGNDLLWLGENNQMYS